MERIGRSARFHELRRVYSDVAIFVLNSLLLLVLFNLALYAAFAGYDARRGLAREGWAAGYARKLKEAYRGFPETELRQLVDETLALSYAYEPFTQFRDRPQRGRFVNVDENGFRHSSAQAPWPPSPESFNVFFFGGSTTFGWALLDASTIPSYFQQLVPRIGGRRTAVYNFARTAYFSTQERILFEQLLLEGQKPDAAVFVDGLNDLHRLDGRPFNASRFATLLEGGEPVIGEWPMVRLARALRNRLPFARPPRNDQEIRDTSEAFQAALARFLGNKKLIESASAISGVVPIFVWQPVSCYKYDNRRYRFRVSPAWRLWSFDAYGPLYGQVEEGSRAGAFGRDFLWCGDVQEGLDEALYLDMLHYTPRLSQLVAECIARQIRERALLPGAGG